MPLRLKTLATSTFPRSRRSSKTRHSSCRTDMRDFTDDIAALRQRLGEAEQYLRIDELRQRRPQLETEASRPDLWDDQELAKKITGELSAAVADIELFDGLVQRVDDA